MIPPRVDLASRKAIEAAVAAREAEKKKQRPAVHVSQYELERMRRGPWVDPAGDAAARLEVEIAPTVSLGVIQLGVP